MRILYESQFQRLSFSEAHGFFEKTWLAATEEMTAAQYRQEFLNILLFYVHIKPRGNISDTRCMYFPIAVELQEWTNEVFFVPVLDTGLRKAAIVSSPEFITQLSIEQTMEASQGVRFLARYFDSLEAARAWMIAQ